MDTGNRRRFTQARAYLSGMEIGPVVTVVAIIAVLVLALWLCAALAIGFLLLTWGAPAAAAFAVFIYADRLGIDTPITLAAAVLTFIAVRSVIVGTMRVLIGWWRTPCGVSTSNINPAR